MAHDLGHLSFVVMTLVCFLGRCRLQPRLDVLDLSSARARLPRASWTIIVVICSDGFWRAPLLWPLRIGIRADFGLPSFISR